MNLLIKRQNAIKSGDYYELLNSIDPKPLRSTKIWDEPYKTKHGIILMPNFSDPDYEKMNNEKIYIKCAAIRFNKNNKIYITCGKSHKDCLENSGKFFKIIRSYERGFLTNNLDYIPSIYANKIIRNYKFNNNHYNFYSHYNLIFDKELTILNEEGKLLAIAKYKIITKTRQKNVFEVDLPADLNIQSTVRKWLVSINLKHKTVVFSERDKEFIFSKLQKIYCDLIKVEL